MIGFDPGPERKALQEKARRFSREVIQPVAAVHDREGSFPVEVMKKAHENGFLTPLIPQRYGGGGLGILDTGNLEARMAADASADAVVVSGLAPTSTMEKAIAEARKVGIYSVVDMLNVQNPAKVIEKLKVKPDIVELHRAIDTEDTAHAWGDIPALKKAAGGKLLVATAGGVRVNVVKDALKAGADILVVGRAITASKDIKHSADEFLDKLEKEEIDQFRVMTDF